MRRAPRVLLVEDQPELRDAYRLMLESRDIRIRAAATGEQALEKIDDSPPDVIVADLGLPDVPGMELIRRLGRAAPESALLILTGSDDPELRRTCRAAGARGFLAKPVEATVLVEAIRRTLKTP